MRFVMVLLLLSSCDRVFGLHSVKVQGLGPDAMVPTDLGETHSLGCADGTREAFVGEPQIAGCAGMWSTPGIPGPPGDPSGASALCETGWHICHDGGEATSKAPINGCATIVEPGMFFATAQGSSRTDLCDGNGSDDVFGCSPDLGSALGSCGMLNRSLGTLTLDIGQWVVGIDGKNELGNVFKGRENGGVLCCIGDL
jgi:hypothetical protein